MGISYKIVLDKRRKNAGNIYPLKARAVKDGVPKEESLGISVHSNNWDAEHQIILINENDAKNKTIRLNAAKAKLDKTILRYETNGEDLSAEMLLQSLNPAPIVKKQDITLRGFSNELIEDLIESKKVGTALAYKDAVNSLIAYQNEHLTLQQINYGFLIKYNTHMLARNVKVNSIAAYLRSIRAIYNKAIKQKLVDKANYPFEDFKIETEETGSRSLSADILSKIFAVELEQGTSVWHYRNYFILSFCLIGMNFGDLLTLEPSHIKNDIVHYQRDKTGKLYSIIVPDIAKMIFKYYKTYHSKNEHRYLLPALISTEDLLLRKKSIKQICKSCNKYMRKLVELCGIETDITTYYARYSWANLARGLGYSKDLIAEALGHEYGNNVTGIYLDKYDSQRINEANERIIELVFKKGA